MLTDRQAHVCSGEEMFFDPKVPEIFEFGEIKSRRTPGRLPKVRGEGRKRGTQFGQTGRTRSPWANDDSSAGVAVQTDDDEQD